MINKEDLKPLVIDETTYYTTFTQKYETRKKYINPDPRKIFSVIPGTILTISVTPGQKVSLGDDLLTFESMKMKNKVRAPMDGKIKSVYIKIGEKIAKNLLMIDFE